MTARSAWLNPCGVSRTDRGAPAWGADGRPGKRGGQGVTRQRHDPAALDWPRVGGGSTRVDRAKRHASMPTVTAKP
jgi:hypothetical protein